MIGNTISHYRILERLGEGGMGEVFRAEDIRLHRPVALKVLRKGPGYGEEERTRLLREGRAASALNHPNIAVIYDIEEATTEEGPVFLLAMEYVAGQTLAKRIAESPPSLDEALDLAAQVADALAEAHARGVIHRDIKPANLMVAQGRVKVLDFGLAHVMRPLSPDAPTWSQDFTAALDREFAGTPHYMSPEQALGLPLDARSDVFSFGVVLYELLAGCRPFEGENLFQVVNAVLHSDPPPLPVRFPDPRLPQLEQLLARMLKKDVATRLGDFREVQDELNRLRRVPPPPVASGGLTVAVAGFANITQRAEDEWLGTGLNETVASALQGIEGLEVWGRERLRQTLRRVGIEVGEIRSDHAVEFGKMVGARWVLAGGFQRLGEQVRVTARVIEVESGAVVRAVKSDGRLESIFELQDRIVAELASGLRGSVAAAHEGEETKVVSAYEALSIGLLNMRADSYEALDRAILYFERAVTFDPEYIRAQVELGAACAQKGDYLAAPELRERAIGIFRRVLEARPRLPRAWRELGATLVSHGRVDEGLECLRRAESLAPDDPRLFGTMARAYFIGRGDFAQAAELYERAVARLPQAGWYWMQLAHCYAFLRDFERGEPAARRAIELQEEFLSGQQGVQVVGAHMRLAHLLALQGRSRESCEACTNELSFLQRMDHALRSRIQIELHMRLGAAHQALGDPTAAAAAFETGLGAYAHRVTLGAHEPYSRYYAGAIHALRGEWEEALAHLEASVAQNAPFMLARARIEPEWDALRGDARFQRLLGTNASG